MSSVHTNFSTSFFRHFAAGFSAPGGKPAIGNEGRGEGFAVSVIRDKLTLSPEGRAAYATYTNKLNRTEQSAPATQTQTESPQAENLEVERETEFNPTFEQPAEMNRLLHAITQIFADNGVKLGEDDVLTVRVSEDGVFSIITDESHIEGVTEEELNELCGMLSEKLNGSQFEGQALSDAFRQVTEQTKETLLTQYAEKAGVDLEEIKNTSISLSFSFGFNSETEQQGIFGLKFQLLDTLSGQELFTIAGKDWTPGAEDSPDDNSVTQPETEELKNAGHVPTSTSTLPTSSTVENGAYPIPKHATSIERIEPLPLYDNSVAIKPRPNENSFSINNTNLLNWGLGLSKESVNGMLSGFSPNSTFLLGKQELKTLTGDVSANWKKLDGKISELLAANNIRLAKGETLNFKVDQNGKIKVGDGVSKDKAVKIEEILNADEALGKELLHQHAKKSLVDGGLASRDTKLSEKTRAILINNILQTETGGSLSDIVFDKGTRGYVSGNEKITALLAAEPDLQNEIAQLLTAEDREGTTLSCGVSFEVSYSYKNGTTIDQSLASKSKLDQRADHAFRWMALELRNQSGPTVVDFNQFGNPVDGRTFKIDMNVLVPSFAEDALRLHQFENGDAELGEHQLRVTFNQSRGVGYHVISPEADAAIEEEIQNVAQKVMGFLSKQASKAIDWMDVGLDGKNQLSVEFGGELLESESLLNKFKTLRLTNTEFQQETNNLMELLQKLHTNGKPFSIRIPSLS